MADYSIAPPGATISPKPFKAHVAEEKLQLLKDLVKLSPIGTASFENTGAGRRYGMKREWLANAKEVWSTSFDWRKHEDRINSYPNFTVPITDDGGITIDVHFIALYSQKKGAIPIAFYHGWPGSVLEFLDMLDLVKKKYTPETLPYHIIVPSLPGYTYSSGPPLDQDYGMVQASMCLDKLMRGLGFAAYLAQGGDIGSRVSRTQASRSDACVGFHLNMISMPPPENHAELEVSALEKGALPRVNDFMSTGSAYAFEHGSRTATIGLALSASPIAMLSWIGEKFLEWTDEDPPLDRILESVSLYYLTDTFPRCIYPYRGETNGSEGRPRQGQVTSFMPNKTPAKSAFTDKPLGYSFFPKDIFPVPGSWAATLGNLVHYSQHDSGGHFAAMEKPAELFQDVEEWASKAWKGQTSGVKL
ncbi:hypothetical protein B0A48_01369 [Cryoendolithus antarcticus]|uniref:Epoxide hydrolase N-terminal domain-containing protein n=1 Tax=Cryoendolithus antarcticus TaxID=1507870 RepID=A0A1V8TT43_9PEZI|nr:hypothetical protein B0A48_01369 [Cryoendolithus antarcticus]